MSEAATTDAAAFEHLRRIADNVLARRVAREPFVALGLGRPVQDLPAIAEDEIEDDASFFAGVLGELERVDAAALPVDAIAFRSALRTDLERRGDAAAHRLLDFVVTPYRGGDLHAEAREALAACDTSRAEGRELRAELLERYVRMVDAMAARTVEQAARGIRLARPAIAPARAVLVETAASVDEAVRPALQRLAAVLDDAYAAQAPEEVGLGGLPGGEAAYRHLVAARADTDLDPAAIHAFGLDSVARLAARKDELRVAIAPVASRDAFERELMTGARWIAASPADVEARFIDYLGRLEPALPRWFGRLPKAPWGVARADPAIEAGMSYGYYERPTAARPSGRYRYNGTRLAERSMIGAQHLIYHELMPGHHLQLSLQAEAAAVHPLQAQLQSMAAVEGWAVYASELAREMGLYEPFELYGHYVMQSFLAARLVVDTGLNALGWTLEQARAYLREHTLEAEGLIDAETLRYSTDIPAQALAYDIGRRAIEQARRHAENRLGAGFDVRAFHDAVLEVGGYPLAAMAERSARLTAGHAVVEEGANGERY